MLSATFSGSFWARIPTTWVGMPRNSRFWMLGGVRMEICTSRAPPSRRSTAISAPELPEPTTSTLLPR